MEDDQSALRDDLDELKRDEFPAVDFEFQIQQGGAKIHLYHFEVVGSAREIGVASTTISDIEAIASRHGVTTLSIRMGLTEPEDDEDEDPTVSFLQSNGFATESPTDGGVDARKRI